MRASLIFLALLAFLGTAEARPGHGGGAGQASPSTCPKGTSDLDDGCSGANPNSFFRDPSFFTTARQSGQSAYPVLPTWNVAGVDYPVGHYTADASLIDADTNVPAGCSRVSANRYFRCSSGVNLDGWKMKGWGLYVDSGDMVINNVHMTMTADNCRSYNGSGAFSMHGSGAITSTYSTYDADDTCKYTAEQYKLASDPGLVTQSSENVTLASDVLTIDSAVTGNFQIGQYIDYPGKPTSGNTARVRINSNISPGTLTKCTGSGCIGTTWGVCATNINGVGATIGSCNSGTVDSSGSVAATTGPVQASFNGPILAASSGNPLDFRYNAGLDFGQYASTNGEMNARFNYANMYAPTGAHVNFIFEAPTVGTFTDAIQSYNTILWPKWSNGGGTGAIDLFTTSVAAAGSGQVTTTNYENHRNVIISNTSLASSNGKMTNSLLRYLSQSNNNATGTHGTLNYTLAGGVMTVTSFTANLGGALQVGDYISCGGSAPLCTTWIQILSFGTGAGGTGTYIVSNSADSLSKTSQVARPYPGVLVDASFTDNFLDDTGTDAPFNFDTGVPYSIRTVSGNIHLTTGNSCNSASACN